MKFALEGGGKEVGRERRKDQAVPESVGQGHRHLLCVKSEVQLRNGGLGDAARH